MIAARSILDAVIALFFPSLLAQAPDTLSDSGGYAGPRKDCRGCEAPWGRWLVVSRDYVQRGPRLIVQLAHRPRSLPRYVGSRIAVGYLLPTQPSARCRQRGALRPSPCADIRHVLTFDGLDANRGGPMSDRLTIDIFGVLHGGAEGLLAIGARADRVTDLQEADYRLNCGASVPKTSSQKPSQL